MTVVPPTHEPGKRNGFWNGILAHTFLVFWVAGGLSVLVDLDHMWKYFGGPEAPCNLTGWAGRPFHHPLFYSVLAFVVSGIVIAFIARWCLVFTVFRKDVAEEKNLLTIMVEESLE